jgi:2-oxoacid:acceptor oxidoreductase gamma subunit (pyruvate/2-ketoisovalerate family)
MHGRGGQGAAKASYMLGEAIFREGKEVQAFPMFGVERRGAPVQAFVRVDDKPIYVRSMVYNPDYVVVLDPTLIQAANVTEGIKPGGLLIINSDLSVDDYDFEGDFDVTTVDGTEIAVEFKLGTRVAPIVNTVMMGAFARAYGELSVENLRETIIENIMGLGLPEKVAMRNADAAEKAYNSLKV